MWFLDNTCIDLNIQNEKVDQSTIGIYFKQLNIKPMLVINQFCPFESPEKETNFKDDKFGIQLKIYYFVNNDQFALNSITNTKVWN